MSANPLWAEWLRGWWDRAREQNSKGAVVYKHAYEALSKCPITFTHPCELKQLRGFGPKLCDRLTEKLHKHCQETGQPVPQVPRGRNRKRHSAAELGQDDDDDDELSPRPAKRPRKTKEYVPAMRSGAYAIIMALAKQQKDSRGWIKQRVIAEAEPYCDTSFTAPNGPSQFYTAWNSMKTLLNKQLVFELRAAPKRYSLTDEGWKVAERMVRADRDEGDGSGPGDFGVAPVPQPALPAPRPAAPAVQEVKVDVIDLASSDDESSTAPRQTQTQRPPPSSVLPAPEIKTGTALEDPAALPKFRPIRLKQGTFTVELVLDVREIRSKTDRDYLQDELAKKGVKATVRSMELGDALWVAKCQDPHFLSRVGAEGDEVVLDYIVERKRLDDLMASIKDGRFREQKFRLGRSGVRNVVYLVEDMAVDAQQAARFEDRVISAVASTQLVDGYFVKRTAKLDDSIRYLARTTAALKALYECRDLHVIPTEYVTTQNYLPLLDKLRCEDPCGALANQAAGRATPTGNFGGYYISYPVFSSLASKSELMTLRDVYLKMLMCTRGVTGEKALEVQARWKTPYELIRALESCSGGGGEDGKRRQREMIAKETEHLVGRKKIGKAVSHKLAEAWGDV